MNTRNRRNLLLRSLVVLISLCLNPGIAEARATAIVQVPPGSQVFLDGNLVATGAVRLESIPPGEHIIDVILENGRQGRASIRSLADIDVVKTFGFDGNVSRQSKSPAQHPGPFRSNRALRIQRGPRGRQVTPAPPRPRTFGRRDGMSSSEATVRNLRMRPLTRQQSVRRRNRGRGDFGKVIAALIAIKMLSR